MTTTCHHHTRYTTTSPMTTTMAAHVLRPCHWRDTTSASGAGNSPVNTAPTKDPGPLLNVPLLHTTLDDILKRHFVLFPRVHPKHRIFYYKFALDLLSCIFTSAIPSLEHFCHTFSLLRSKYVISNHWCLDLPTFYFAYNHD